MKPNPIFVAAAGFAMLGACSVTTKNDNATESDENGAAATVPEGNVLPMTDNEAQSGEADTLGDRDHLALDVNRFKSLLPRHFVPVEQRTRSGPGRTSNGPCAPTRTSRRLHAI